MSLIKNLSFNLGAFSLEVPELLLPDSGITAIQGPSGSGKTTFLKVLIGLHDPKGWSWEFKGELLSSLPVRERRLGVVFQNYDLFPHLSAEENIRLVLNSRYEKSARPAQEEKLKNYFKKLNLEKSLSTRASELSGGEKQRVALLRALFSNPRLLLLDEPFSALDPELKTEARTILKNIVEELNIPVLLVTHDSQDVDFLTRSVVRIKNGKILNSN